MCTSRLSSYPILNDSFDNNLVVIVKHDVGQSGVYELLFVSYDNSLSCPYDSTFKPSFYLDEKH